MDEDVLHLVWRAVPGTYENAVAACEEGKVDYEAFER